MSQSIEKYVDLPSQLVDQMQARTVGELLEIDFPVAVGHIDRTLLGRYAEDADMGLYDPLDEEGPAPYKVTDVRLTQNGHLRSNPAQNKIHPAFQECAAITRAIENRLLTHRKDLETENYRLSMKGRANPFPDDMIGCAITPAIHANLASTPPNGRHYTASSEQPAFFASHEDTMRILKETGYEKILAHELDPLNHDVFDIQKLFLNSFGTIISMIGHMEGIDTQEIRLQKALIEAMQPAEDGELTAFSSLTFHTDSGLPKRGRVAFDAAVHNSPDYRYEPDPMMDFMGFAELLGSDFE